MAGVRIEVVDGRSETRVTVGQGHQRGPTFIHMLRLGEVRKRAKGLNKDRMAGIPLLIASCVLPRLHGS